MLAKIEAHKVPALSGEPWFIVAHEIRRHALAKEGLERNDFGVFCPIVKRWKRRARKYLSHSQRKRNLSLEQVDEALFPGYMFVQRGPSSPGLARLFEITAVRGVVKFGDHLAMLTQTFVEKLKRDIAGGLLDEHHMVTPFSFKVDETVRVSEGVFCGHNAIIDRIDESGESIHVLAQLFGRQCRIALSIDQIEKL